MDSLNSPFLAWQKNQSGSVEALKNTPPLEAVVRFFENNEIDLPKDIIGSILYYILYISLCLLLVAIGLYTIRNRIVRYHVNFHLDTFLRLFLSTTFGTFFELYAFIILTSTLLLGINSL